MRRASVRSARGWSHVEAPERRPDPGLRQRHRPTRAVPPPQRVPPRSGRGVYVPGDRMPRGTDIFTVFEWLDDDTLALMQGGNNSVGDIITCHLSDGSCDLAVKGAPPDKYRMVAGGALPG